jgi:hypothetical protein
MRAAVRLAGRHQQGGLLNQMFDLHVTRMDWLMEVRAWRGWPPRGRAAVAEAAGEEEDLRGGASPGQVAAAAAVTTKTTSPVQGSGGGGGGDDDDDGLFEGVVDLVGCCCFEGSRSGSGSPPSLEHRWRALLEDCMAAMTWCIHVYSPAGQHHPARRQLAR